VITAIVHVTDEEPRVAIIVDLNVEYVANGLVTCQPDTLTAALEADSAVLLFG